MVRRIGYGIVAWVIPYATAIPLLGVMQRDPQLFHNVMIVEGMAIGAVLACAYFASITRRFLFEGVLLGLVWMVVNWALDLVALVPFAQLTLPRYFIEIGFTYLCMPALTIALGYVLGRRQERAAATPLKTAA